MSAVVHRTRSLAAVALVGSALGGIAVAEDSARPLSPAERATYERAALTHDGDPARGRALVLDENRTKCVVCHKLDGRGGDVGPDLSHIGGKFDRRTGHYLSNVVAYTRLVASTHAS